MDTKPDIDPDHGTDGRTAALLLVALRAVGGAAFLAPTLGTKTFAIRDDAEGAYLVRLFAARNLAMAGGLLLSRGRARRLWFQAGVVCDALDTAAGLMGLRTGKKASSATVDTLAALAATAIGVAGLRTGRREEER
ncbi:MULTISPECIES: hypothetical protein [Streptomyces]|uniref:hypothetical protein n=1 Tax=Streptomyces TaxID=1883 RepID=UPI00292D0929|nr:hypothetical protein [Streptomyces sp. NEAU-HV9]